MGIGRQHQDVNDAQEKIVGIYSVGKIDVVEKVNAMERINATVRIDAS